jgi:hypothetical protein
MSYAGKGSRGQRGNGGAAGRSATATRLSGRGGAEKAPQRPPFTRALSLRTKPDRQAPGNSPEAEIDWTRVAIFATGIALGLTAGAGVALLLAPQSGKETRHDIARRGRRLRANTFSAWDDLRDDLQLAARRGRRKLARVVRRVRYRDDDPLDPPARERVAG